MAIGDFKNILSIFGGAELSEENQDALFKEVLLMTLSRAADADINIQPAEIERVRQILKEYTGEDFSSADIRVEARKEMYARASLEDYLASVSKKMRAGDRGRTVQALADVFRSDSNVSVLEVDFFDGVAKALGATPAQLAGLTAGDV